MKNTNLSKEIQLKIVELESKRDSQLSILKEDYNSFTSTLGIIGSLISRKSYFNESSNPIKNHILNFLQSGIMKYMFKNPSLVKIAGGLIINYFFSKIRSKL